MIEVVSHRIDLSDLGQFLPRWYWRKQKLSFDFQRDLGSDQILDRG